MKIFALLMIVWSLLRIAWTAPKTWTSEPLTSSDLNTYMRDNQLLLREGNAKQYVRTATDYTTTSNSLVNVDGTNMAHTLTTVGNDVLVTFCARISTNSGGGRVAIAVDIDGTPYTLSSVEPANPSDEMNLSFSYIFAGLSAASHTFTLQWLTDDGTATIIAGTTLFDVREINGLI